MSSHDNRSQPSVTLNPAPPAGIVVAVDRFSKTNLRNLLSDQDSTFMKQSRRLNRERTWASVGSNSLRIIFFPQIFNKSSPGTCFFGLCDRRNNNSQAIELASDMENGGIAADENWHATIDVVIAASAEKVWAIASDWLGFPRHCTVECMEGQNGVPGCVRRVQAHSSSFWVAEKLTHIDHHNRILAYDLVGGNSGIAVGYKSALQVIPEGKTRTRVVWPFMFSPEQVRVDALTVIVETKLKARITELEELAQES